MNPVSEKLAVARSFSVLPWFVVFAVALAVFAWYASAWLWIVVAFLLACCAWLAWLIPAQVKRTGWRETEDELMITKGKILHTLTVVPYGRIQFVDVSSGPIERRLGLKSIELHTASTSSDACVPGLAASEADELCARLAQKARERMSGL